MQNQVIWHQFRWKNDKSNKFYQELNQNKHLSACVTTPSLDWRTHSISLLTKKKLIPIPPPFKSQPGHSAWPTLGNFLPKQSKSLVAWEKASWLVLSLFWIVAHQMNNFLLSHLVDDHIWYSSIKDFSMYSLCIQVQFCTCTMWGKAAKKLIEYWYGPDSVWWGWCAKRPSRRRPMDIFCSTSWIWLNMDELATWDLVLPSWVRYLSRHAT